MAVCGRCHHMIHFGGEMLVSPDSLAARGDSGLGLTPLWREYLSNH